MDRKFVCFVIVFSTLFVCVLSGCGGSSSAKGVPDRTAELVVLDYLEEEDMESDDYDSYRFTVDHNYDKSSNTDAATINMTIEYTYATQTLSIPVWYTYNKSSDLWALQRKGSWTEGNIVYNCDMLVGRWYLDWFNDHYEINIKSADASSVTLDYSISAPATVSMGLDPDVYLNLEGRGSYENYGGGFTIPIDLPDGFYCNSSRSAKLRILLSPQRGCYAGYIDGQLYYIP